MRLYGILNREAALRRVGLLAALALAALLPAGAPFAQTDPAAYDRGRYLFETLLACRTCHDEPGGARRMLAGGARFAQEGGPSGHAPNVTPDRDTGIGAWSDAEIARAIREGIRPDGSVIAPVMAFELYRRISDDDIRAIVAYLRTVPPVRKYVPRTDWGKTFPPYGPPLGPVPPPDPRNRAAVGAYLAGPLGECIACHTPYDDTGRPDYANRLGAGGTTFDTPQGEAVAGNITSDRDTGLGAFSDDQIKAMIVAGIRPNRTRTNPVMPHSRFGRLRPADLDAIVLYLRTLPPIRNMIDK